MNTPSAKATIRKTKYLNRTLSLPSLSSYFISSWINAFSYDVHQDAKEYYDLKTLQAQKTRI